MNFSEAVKAFYQNYADFSGRTTRAGYWWPALFFIVVYAILWGITAAAAGLGITLIVLFWLSHIIPNLAVTVRRLHDSGKSGWFILFVFVPFVGGLILLIFMLLPSDAVGNDWGMPADGVKLA
jgi:uncharacterized membrane protein YhaH (DUF805 family)